MTRASTSYDYTQFPPQSIFFIMDEEENSAWMAKSFENGKGNLNRKSGLFPLP